MNAQPSASGPVQTTPVQPSQKMVGVAHQSFPSVQIAAKSLSQESRKAVSDTPLQQQVTAAEFRRATEELQRSIHAVAPELDFSVDRESGRTIIKVTDPDTKEIIRQIPAEEALRLNKEIDRFLGLLVNRKA